MKIALTGGIACGKSLLSRFLNELGVETLDADDIVHELIPDPSERRRIAAEVFADTDKRRALEEKVHPFVKARIDQWLDVTTDDRLPTASPKPLDPETLKPYTFRIAVIPLLFEVHWERNFDIISCVVSSREKQIERMTTTRGMTREQAEARLAAQLPVEEKAKRSHYVIRNEGSPEELKAQAAEFLKWLKTAIHHSSLIIHR